MPFSCFLKVAFHFLFYNRRKGAGALSVCVCVCVCIKVSGDIDTEIHEFDIYYVMVT